LDVVGEDSLSIGTLGRKLFMREVPEVLVAKRDAVIGVEAKSERQPRHKGGDLGCGTPGDRGTLSHG
jgi:hypothetical protein